MSDSSPFDSPGDVSPLPVANVPAITDADDLPNAVFIGFTGTPLLKKDSQTSFEVFGALFNNLKHDEGLALRIDEVVRRRRPDGWRGVQAREQVIKAALYEVLKDVGEVERIFPIIRAQREY